MAGMIRVDTVTDLKPLDRQIEFYTRYPRYVNTITRSVFAEAPTLLTQLKVEAPARTGKWGGWSTDKRKNMRAQRKFFAMLASGEIKSDGQHTIRTHKLRDGYTANVFIKGTETLIEVRNSAKHYKFVKGRRQVPGHTATGWAKDDPIIRNYVVGFRRRLLAALATGRRSLTSIR